MTTAQVVGITHVGPGGVITHGTAPYSQISKFYPSTGPRMAPEAVRKTPKAVDKVLQVSQDWDKYPPTQEQKINVQSRTGYTWDPLGKGWKAPTYGSVKYGRYSPYTQPQQKYEYVSVRDPEAEAYARLEQRAIKKAAETPQAKLGHAFSWPQVGGIKTGYEMLVEPQLLAKMKVGPRITGLSRGWEKRYRQQLKKQYQRLSDKYRRERQARTEFGYREPERFLKQEAVGVATTTALLLAPEYLPGVVGAFAARAPVGFVELAKVPIGAGLIAMGGKEIKKALPKVIEGEPGSTFETLMGVGLVAGGAHLTLSGGTKWLKWKGQQLIDEPIAVRFLEPKTKMEAFKRGAKIKLGRKYKALGEFPGKVVERFRKPRYEYRTETTSGARTTIKYDTSLRGPEKTTELLGPKLDKYGKFKGFTAERGKITIRTTPKGTVVTRTTPIIEGSYKGLPKDYPQFDVLGYYGGEVQARPSVFTDAPAWERSLAKDFLPSRKYGTTPSLIEVREAGKGIDQFSNLVDRYPKKSFRISGRKTYVGTERIITDKAPKLLDVLPEGSKGVGELTVRFVEPKRPLKIKVTKTPPGDLKAAQLRIALERAGQKEGGLSGKIWDFELKAVGIKQAGPGDTIVLGSAGRKPSTLVVSGAAARTRPRVVTVPAYSYRVRAPGEPVIPGISKVAGPATLSLTTRPSKTKVGKSVQSIRQGITIKSKVDSARKLRAKPIIDTTQVGRQRSKIGLRVLPRSKRITRQRSKADISLRAKPKITTVPKQRVEQRQKQDVKTIPKYRYVPRPRPMPRYKPRPRKPPPTTNLNGGPPRRRASLLRARARRPRRARERGKVIVPRADYLSLQLEELRTGKRAKHPPITRLTTREYRKRLASPSRAALRFPTAREYRRLEEARRRRRGARGRPRPRGPVRRKPPKRLSIFKTKKKYRKKLL